MFSQLCPYYNLKFEVEVNDLLRKMTYVTDNYSIRLLHQHILDILLLQMITDTV